MHSIYMKADGSASCAYVGQVPWHGLGQELPEGADLETWSEAAGFNFRIDRGYVRFQDKDGTLHKVPDRVVLHRSDDAAPLSVVSTRYKVVQPSTVLEFFRDTASDNAWKLETAGVLGNGGKYWALAKTPLDASVLGDEHRAYVLLATSCDLSLATSALLTSVRVVCNNTLQAAMADDKGKAVKIKHSTTFNPEKVREELGLVDLDASWSAFTDRMNALGEIEVYPALATEYFSELLRPTNTAPRCLHLRVQLKRERLSLQAESLETLLDAPFSGRAHKANTDQSSRAIRGLADLETSYVEAPGARPGTAYGLVQGVTHYLDHVRGKDADKRLTSTWFGQGQAIKARALELAETLKEAA
jgi:phage/plasmid-like protein (TIGR03299 family)